MLFERPLSPHRSPTCIHPHLYALGLFSACSSGQAPSFRRASKIGRASEELAARHLQGAAGDR